MYCSIWKFIVVFKYGYSIIRALCYDCHYVLLLLCCYAVMLLLSLLLMLLLLLSLVIIIILLLLLLLLGTLNSATYYEMHARRTNNIDPMVKFDEHNNLTLLQSYILVQVTNTHWYFVITY